MNRHEVLFIKGICKAGPLESDEGFIRFKEKFDESGVEFDLDGLFWGQECSSGDSCGSVPVTLVLQKLFSAIVKHQSRFVLFHLPTEFHYRNLQILRALKKCDESLAVVVEIDKRPLFDYPKLIIENFADLVITKMDLKIRSLRDIFETGNVPYGVIAKGKNGHVKYGAQSESINSGHKIDLFLFPSWNWDFPPLGLAQVAAALLEGKHDVRVHDVNVDFWKSNEGNPDRKKFYENVPIWEHGEAFYKEVYPQVHSLIGRWVDYLEKRGTRFVGISLFNTSVLVSHEFAKALKKAVPSIKIVIGGPSADSMLGQAWLDEKIVDAVVFAEGEFTIQEVIRAWIQGEEKAVSGAWLLKSDGSIIKGAERPQASLDQLPFPYYGDFDIYGYGELRLPIYFSRGCIAKCVFCFETQYWKRFRLASTERILREIRQNIERYGIVRFYVGDSLMNGSHGLLENLADGIIKDGLKISYSGLCRLDKRLTHQLLDKMKRSGCARISFGMESASQKVLNAMQKRTDVKVCRDVIRDTHSLGISCKLLMMVGFPGESWWNYAETVWFIFRMRRHIDEMNLTMFTPVPGTPVYDNWKTYGIDFGDRSTGFHWKSDQGRNTFYVRYFRYKTLQFLWKVWKGKPAQNGIQRYEDLVEIFESSRGPKNPKAGDTGGSEHTGMLRAPSGGSAWAESQAASGQDAG